MSQEEHRAPARLAPVRPGWTAAAPVSTLRKTQRPLAADYEIIDAVEEDGQETVFNPEPPPVEQPKRRSSIMPAISRDVPPPPVDPPPQEAMLNERQTAENDGDMTTQEQYELLLHNIQLCDDLWKLAGIRANEKNNWLTAYLIPRTKQMDLKTAIAKNQVLIITIDNRGNTDIKEPRKRGLFRHLTAWLYGE